MRTPNVAASSAKTLVATSILDKIRAGFSVVFNATSVRFEQAATAFRQRKELEELLIQQATETPFEAPKLRSIRLVGFLVDTENASQVPLSEGTNYLEVLEDGALKTRFQRSEDSDGNYITLKAVDNQIEVRADASPDQHQTVRTNAFVTLGKNQFLLKILPEEFRTNLNIKEDRIMK